MIDLNIILFRFVVHKKIFTKYFNIFGKKGLQSWSCWHYLQILLIMTSLPTPFNVEVPRELSSYVGAPQTSTLKGERREINSYIS